MVQIMSSVDEAREMVNLNCAVLGLRVGLPSRVLSRELIPMQECASARDLGVCYFPPLNLCLTSWEICGKDSPEDEAA
jgi:hypothetical protein